MINKRTVLIPISLLIGFQANSMSSYSRRFHQAIVGAAVYGSYSSISTNCEPTQKERLEFYKHAIKPGHKKMFSHSIPQNSELKNYPELAKFMATYRCPKELEDSSCRPSHILKKNHPIDRLINAERMKHVIEKEKLHHLEVPDKCLCKKNNDDNNFNLLSKRLEFKNGVTYALAGTRAMDLDDKFSLTEVQQLTILAEKTSFSDWPSNLNRTTEHKLAIYDTERFSFWGGQHSRHIKLTQTADTHTKYDIIHILGRYLEGHMEPNAKEWFDQKLRDLADSEDGKVEILPLQSNPTYDSHIDFEQVKKDIVTYRKKSVKEAIKEDLRAILHEDAQRDHNYFSRCYWSKNYCKLDGLDNKSK